MKEMKVELRQLKHKNAPLYQKVVAEVIEPQGVDPDDKGSYTVNSDCTGSFTDSTAGLDFNFVIVNGGAELFAIQSDTGYVSLLQAKMQ